MELNSGNALMIEGASVRVGHLTPHLGGGVGVVLDGLIQVSPSFKLARFSHQFFCLEVCKSIPPFIREMSCIIEENLGARTKKLTELISSVDVLVCHYWNHPLTASVLMSGAIPETRLLFWVHNSGLQEPNIVPTCILRSNAKVIFSSPASLLSPNVVCEQKRQDKVLEVIPSVRSLDKFTKITRNFRSTPKLKKLLYVGTVSTAKMHPESARLFARLSRIGYVLDVVGGDDEICFAEHVKSCEGEIRVHGWSNDVIKFYSEAYIFVYPLRPGHYGTGEQVILEAMASGLPVIAFDNPAERSIIIHGETGFLAKSGGEFLDFVEILARDETLYTKMSGNSVKRVVENFNYKEITKNFYNAINVQKSLPPVSLENSFGYDINDKGLIALAEYSFFQPPLSDKTNARSLVDELFRRICMDIEKQGDPSSWLAETKGSPFHYLSFFPESAGLCKLCELLVKRFRPTRKEG
jgi:glycosyltransferase involved in cell wall biosynthesis